MIAAQGQGVRLRLLDTTHTFASRRLAESDEEDRWRRRHALYFNDLFKQGAAMDMPERVGVLGVEVDGLDKSRVLLTGSVQHDRMVLAGGLEGFGDIGVDARHDD